METIALSKMLERGEEGVELALRIARGEVELDWSGVDDASEAFIAALFGATPIEELPDGMGIATMSETLAKKVLAMAREASPPRSRRAPRRKISERSMPAASNTSPVTPAIWRAPPEAPPARSAGPKRAELSPLDSATLRKKLEERIVRDLLGPAGGDEEELDEARVSDRYLVGLLSPSRLRVRVGREEADAVGAGSDAVTEDGEDDDGTLSSDTIFPSSIGMSFCIEAGARVRVEARWGRYRKVKRATPEEDGVVSRAIWRREPMGGSAEITLGGGAVTPIVLDTREPKVTVEARVRPRGSGQLVVSMFLLNGQDEPEERRDEAWIFQPELSVTCLDRAAIVGRDGDAKGARDFDERLSRMAYRNSVKLAVGHGVGVTWEPDEAEPGRTRRICTRVVPSGEVPVMSARTPPGVGGPTGPHEDPKLAGLVLDMKALAESTRETVASLLQPLVVAYDAWITKERARLADPKERLGPHERTAKEALKACERASGRIRDGIDLLARDETAHAAFAFANRAMWLQRVRGALAQKRRRGEHVLFEDVDTPKNRSWRTFQLAFVLINLASLADLHHPDRADDDTAAVDLLWFPTGGGKTEAYLGVAAFAMGIRRLQGVLGGHDGEHGVTVLMRYTLRLLTLQQFQRATSLICAAEHIRREALAKGDGRWGREPFRIGLWVGGRSTPNKTAHAEEALKQERSTGGPQMGAIGGMGSPVQLKTCPWCGESIEPSRDMRVETFQKGRGRTLIFCGDRRGECLFSERQSEGEGLPVLVVDEEIYRKLPALLIATVDKFAQMPWKGPVGMLFGQVNGVCDRHGFRSPDLEDSDNHPKKDRLPQARTEPHGPLRPPDLVIQDELHLISGPLGTLTALYETAIDELCTWTLDGARVRPKVIASTATVRRADEQVRALFHRDVRVFPPPGLSASDNFFAVERPLAEVPGRRYLGICAPGRRIKLALIRAYSAALTAAQSLFLAEGTSADPWMTLVGYFGSLRELAGMRRLVDDDIANRIMKMEARGLAKRRITHGTVQELTSRLGSVEIPRLLERLEVPFEPHSDGEPREPKRRHPIDVLLATNMISVGVDVARLGLMVCAGQPKTTAEYIQATSRVGRDQPGLVLTVYNWARPRDMSHYETFEHYHATFYEHVEANSVTPFSPRALDRGLAGVLVSLVRQASTRLNANEAAQSIDDRDATVRRAVTAIVDRAGGVEVRQDTRESVRERVEALLHRWRERASKREGGVTLGYAAANDGHTIGLLEHAGRGERDAFTCLDSLRDVEPAVALVLDEGSLDAQKPAGGGTQ